MCKRSHTQTLYTRIRTPKISPNKIEKKLKTHNKVTLDSHKTYHILRTQQKKIIQETSPMDQHTLKRKKRK